MAERMQRFVKLAQSMPEKRPAADRREDFAEIYAAYAGEKAAEQASRCSQCGVPFCQVHCPLGNNIPDWLRMTAEGRIEEAWELAEATNNFPEICGRICPQDRLCEGHCVIEKDFEAVTIGAVEKFITDQAFEKGWIKPLRPLGERSQSAGIIGAGPAGLAAAEELRRQGYRVHVYDRYDRMGGLLIYGIPNFKLDKDVVARRVRRLAEGGVVFHEGFEVGREASLAELRARHDTILIATGVYRMRDFAERETELAAPLSGIVQALPYLTAANRAGLGEKVSGHEDGSLLAKGKRVVVIGGGDTAMDCVRTAVRQGALSVTCLYRRDRANMPGSAREVHHAEEEGVNFAWLAAPRTFIARGRGRERGIAAVEAARMRLGPPGAGGRSGIVELPGEIFRLEADLVIKALGFEAEDLPRLFGEPGLEVRADGTVKTRGEGGATGLEGVFAAGDIRRGASLVVWAIRDGREAAAAMHRHMMSRAAAAGREGLALAAAS